jgi:hypothetical protein
VAQALGGKIGDALDREIVETRQDFRQVFAHRDLQSAAACSKILQVSISA